MRKLRQSLLVLVVPCLFFQTTVNAAETAKTPPPGNVQVTKTKPKVYYAPDPAPKHNMSRTTGWRPVQTGYESLIQRDPSLRHWSWNGMREMGKEYVHLRPGEVRTKRRSVYIKPKSVTTAAPVQQHTVQTVAPPGFRYVKPKHVPLPTRSSLGTNYKLSVPATKATVAVPAVSGKVSVPSVTGKVRVSGTRAQVATPPATTQVSASMKKRFSETAPVGDAMSDLAGDPGADSFASPELQDTASPYGKPTIKAPVSTAASKSVRGKVVKK